MKMKTNVKSNIIYSPQNYLEALTGKCYIIHGREPVLKQVCRILKENDLPARSYPLKDTVRAVRVRYPIVLVDCSEFTEDMGLYRNTAGSECRIILMNRLCLYGKTKCCQCYIQ